MNRWPLWAALLAGAGWLALLGDKTPAADSAAASLPARAVPAASAQASRTAPAPRQSSSDQALQMLRPRDTVVTAAPPRRARRDLFAATTWVAPPAPPAAPAAVAPVPPAFNYFGKKQEAGEWEVYLGRGEQTFLVRKGATIDGSYRVVDIAPPTLTLADVASGHTFTIPIGDAL